MNFLRKVFLILSVFYSAVSFGQDDLLDSLEKSMEVKREPVIASFKGTRLVNLQTIETLGKGSLDFRITHRFGDFSSGLDNMFGLDGPATIKLGFDYGVTNRLMIGVGRSSLGKLYDGFIKYRIFRQTTDGHIPLSVTGISSVNITSVKDFSGTRYPTFSSRMAYLFQLVVAKKFNSKLTMQLSPMLIHYNLVEHPEDKNDIYALAASGRFKVSKSISITGEYIYRINDYTTTPDLYHNSGSVGLDIETGGHVFQLFVTNSFAINEVQVVPYTSSSWTKGQVRLGFNVSRVFGLTKYAREEKRKQKKNKSW